MVPMEIYAIIFMLSWLVIPFTQLDIPWLLIVVMQKWDVVSDESADTNWTV